MSDNPAPLDASGFEAEQRLAILANRGPGDRRSGADRVLDELAHQRARIELLEAHVENLITRVYELEGGDR